MLAAAWQALGGEPGLLELVSTTGDPGLSSLFAVGDLALGAVAAHRLAAAEHEADGRAVAPVLLDARHIGVAFRSERFLKVDGVPAPAGFAPLSRFWPAADGWVRLHANYPQHREAVDRALGPDPGAAVAERTSQDVEDVVVAAGGVAAKVRTAPEWLLHPQGRAVRDLPLLSLRQVAPGSARERQVRGLRVLDLTRVIAGPVGTRTLASYGADVLRVDSPHNPEDGYALLETGPGKRHVHLDLADRTDRVRFDELLSQADVLVQGYRPGALGAHGLHPDQLAERRPGLVVVTLSAWGSGGPWSQRRGFDSIVQAASGIADRTRGVSGVPGVLPAQALDHGAGHLLAATVLRALTRGRQEGGTWHGELSLAQLAAWLLASPLSNPVGADVPVDAGPYLMNVPSRSGTLTIVRPPGSPPWVRGPVLLEPEQARWHRQPFSRPEGGRS
jgi:crotonobetainyl-CoA:carnitine CoA-transferase CaiB-like acyl-CoA transferase